MSSKSKRPDKLIPRRGPSRVEGNKHKEEQNGVTRSININNDLQPTQPSPFSFRSLDVPPPHHHHSMPHMRPRDPPYSIDYYSKLVPSFDVTTSSSNNSQSASIFASSHNAQRNAKRGPPTTTTFNSNNGGGPDYYSSSPFGSPSLSSPSMHPVQEISMEDRHTDTTGFNPYPFYNFFDETRRDSNDDKKESDGNIDLNLKL